MDQRNSGERVTATRFVGRSTEIAQLEASWQQAHAGSGRCLLIVGEAGVGKSRLLSKIMGRAGEEEATIIVGRCFESDASFPYAPLIDGLRTLLADKTAAETAELLGPLAPDLHRLLPELARTVPPNEIVRPQPLSPEAEKRRLFETLAQLFTRRLAVTGKRPLLLVMEDVHWSDEVSLEFFHFFIRRLATFPILLLLSYRSQERSPQLTSFLTQLNRERLAQAVTLQPLTRRETALLLQEILGQPAAPSFTDALFNLTEGNPFFIEEVLNALAAGGDLVHKNGRWQLDAAPGLHIPPSLLLAVQQRTRRLSEAAQEVLALAAVAGRQFNFALLQRLTNHSESQLLALIKEMIAAQLVVEETADRFAFRHALSREAVYAALLARERRLLHRTIAEDLAAAAGDAPHGRRLANLAYHTYAAGLWAQALDYGQRAGVAAQHHFAPRAALAHFRRAAAAAEQTGQLLPVRTVQMRGKAHELAGNFEAARTDFETVLARAEEMDDHRLRWEALRDLGFLWMARDYDQTGVYLQQALDLARKLQDEELLAHSLNRLGNWLANVERPSQALTYHEEALAIFEARGDQRETAVTLDLIATTYGILGNAARSAATYRRAIPLFRAVGDRQGLASSLIMLASYDDIPAGEEALTITRDIRWRDGEANAHMRLSLTHLLRGDFGRALAHGRRCRAIAQEVNHMLWRMGAHQRLGMAYYFMLALDKARRHLQQALDLAQAGAAPIWQQTASANLALVDVSAGDVDQAAALLANAGAADADVTVVGGRFLAVARIEVALAQERAADALRLVDGILQQLPALRQWRDLYLPFLLHQRGRALAAQERRSEAEAALAEALAPDLGVATRPLQWRIHADLARVRLAQQRREDAQQALQAAQDLIAELAETIPDTERRQFFRQETAVRLPTLPTLTRRQRLKQQYGGLTRREREVAAHVALGKTNREIADALHITVRTAKTHVGNILSKLDYTSRTQIAAWAVDNELPEYEKLV